MRLLTLALFGLFLSACATEKRFVETPLYVVDLTNGVCARYKIIDTKKLLWQLEAELPLLAGGPCDRLTGFDIPSFTKVKNWIRDEINDNRKQVQVQP